MSDSAIMLVTTLGDIVEPFRSAARSLGREVIWVESSTEAHKQLKRVPVSIIVADEMMAGLSGIDFLLQMQTAAPYAVRMLILDANSPAERAIDAVNNGRVSRFIRKPLDDQAEVRRILEEGVAAFLLEEQEREAVESLQYVVHGKVGAPNPRTLQIERLCTMGEMAGSLIHKFNNTLTIMMGHLDLLIDEIRGTEMEKRLLLVSQAASDGVDLARTLQEFIRTGPSERQTLNVNNVISETIRMTEPIWKSTVKKLRAPIELKTEFGRTPNVQGNLPELREVLTNLILNAVDAMPDGGNLTVRTATVSGNIQIQVTDEGNGISTEILERIFDPFFTTKGKKGNGLGLSIVNRIVADHRGHIDVASTPGSGTTFTIVLPPTDFSASQAVEVIDLASFPEAPSLS